MRITEILSTQEQINLVRLIMNTTLNALGQSAQPSATAKSPVVQAVQKNRKPTVKAPKIPTPPAPKPFPQPKPLVPANTLTSGRLNTEKPLTKQPLTSARATEKPQGMMPKRLQPLPTSILSPINKNPSPSKKKELEKKTELADFLKNAQKNR